MKREFSEEHRRKLSESQRGKSKSVETREKIRQKALGRKMEDAPWNKRDHDIIDGKPHKHCAGCKAIKAIEEFPKNSSRWDGLHTYCKKCHCEMRKNYYHENDDYRAYVIQKRNDERREVKYECLMYMGGKCLDCGLEVIKNKNEAIFDFHHLNPEKKDFAIGAQHNLKFDYLKSELDKCVSLCRNCHGLRHYREKENKKALTV